MPALTTEDVSAWGRSRVETEMKDRLGDVQSIREKNDGSLANAKGDDADSVRQHNADLGVLGERMDAIKELERADADAQQLDADLKTPARRMTHSNGDDPVDDRRKIDPRDGGSIFADSDAVKSFREDGRKGIEAEVPIGSLLPEYRSLDVKGFRHPQMKATLGSDDALTDVDTEFPPESVRVGVLVEQRFQAPNIADLMPQATIGQPAVPFMRETVVAEGAVETAEGALLPEASISFTEDSAPVRKIGVMLPVTEEILEDESMLRGHVNGRLPLFIRNREDGQLLNGNGTGQNLQGLLGLSGIDTTTTYGIAADTTGQDALEAIFRASMRVLENFVNPDAAVLGLGLWERLRLSKDGNNNYLIAPATDQAVPRVWGLRVVTNQRMPAEAATNEPILVGGFSESSQIWRRRAITLAVSDSHEDNFGRDILVVKATSRLAVTHYRPGGYATVTSAA